MQAAAFSLYCIGHKTIFRETAFQFLGFYVSSLCLKSMKTKARWNITLLSTLCIYSTSAGLENSECYASGNGFVVCCEPTQQ